MSAQYIYSMRKLTRFYPPDREVLKDIAESANARIAKAIVGSGRRYAVSYDVNRSLIS